MILFQLLRDWGPVVLAVVTAIAVDRLVERRGLLPPGMRVEEFPEVGTGQQLGPAFRRTSIGAALAVLLWLGVFAPLGQIGIASNLDFSSVHPFQLFGLHILFLVFLAAWYLAGFGGARFPQGTSLAGEWSFQLGLRAPNLYREIGIGLVAGVLSWLLMIIAMVAIGALIWMLGGDELVPTEAPAMVSWLVGLPVLLRLAISLSAGFCEEVFFRGYLQPRIGVVFSSCLFVLAHASYEQPLMLVGVTGLSLIFAGLVKWRGNLWAAIGAHATFDAVQLLIVIPRVLELVDPHSGVVAIGQ